MTELERDEPKAAVTIGARGGALWAAAFIVAVGALFVWQSVFLSFGQLTLPGPGAFPMVLGIALMALSGLTFAGALRAAQTGEPVALGHRDVVIVVLAMLLVPVLFEPLGALVTLGLLCAALLVFVGRVAVVFALSAAAVFMLGCWFFFQVLLGLQLPRGVFL